jgi:hypothetical protein
MLPMNVIPIIASFSTHKTIQNIRQCCRELYRQDELEQLFYEHLSKHNTQVFVSYQCEQQMEEHFKQSMFRLLGHQKVQWSASFQRGVVSKAILSVPIKTEHFWIVSNRQVKSVQKFVPSKIQKNNFQKPTVLYHK